MLFNVTNLRYCFYGGYFDLQFEWAWQHPVESLAVRKAAVEFKSLSGIANKIKLAYTMLTLPSWQKYVLTLSLLSKECTSIKHGHRHRHDIACIH